MSAVADVMDLVMSIGSKNPEKQLNAQTKHSATTLVSYVVFFVVAVAVVHTFTTGQFSVVLTLGSGVQCLGFFLLSQKVKYQKTVAGLSSKTLEMYVFFFFVRLGSTLFKEGYLPVDKTGDHCYQIADIGSLLIVINLVYNMHRTHKDTYQKEFDTLPIYNAIPACFLIGYFLHGPLNGNVFFDRIWMTSTMLDSIAMLPQLWMLAKLGGRVESLTAHFVASLVVSRVFAFLFWLYGFQSCAPKKGGPNIAGWLIVGSHAFQLLLCADFMYYYVKGMLSKGKNGARGMMLPTVTDV